MGAIARLFGREDENSGKPEPTERDHDFIAEDVEGAYDKMGGGDNRASFGVWKDGYIETRDSPKVAWKYLDGCVARVVIPRGATVVSPQGSDKLRTDRLYVDEIFDVDSGHIDGELIETDETVGEGYYSGYEYHEETLYEVDTLNTMPQNECNADGIYFYAERRDAIRSALKTQYKWM